MTLNVQGKRLSWLCILSAFLIALSLAFVPASAYAEEQTGEATTEIYLVASDSGTTPDSGDNSGNTTPEGSTTTITTTTTTEGDGSSSSTSGTGDTTPVIPFVVAGIAAAAVITGVAIKKHTSHNHTKGGVNL